MHVLMIFVGALALWASAARSAEDDDRAAVRKQSERYTAALIKGDKAGLEELLHKDYQGRSLPGLANFPKGDKAQAISHWLGKSFTHLEVEVDSIRLFGDTAIEAGTLSASLKEYGSKATWNKLAYTRVWVREGKGWRLVHEQF